MHYAVAVVVVGATLLARGMLNPWIDHGLHVLLTFSALLPLAVALRPAAFLLAAAASLVGTWFLFLPSERRLVLEDPVGAVELGIIGLACATTALTAHLSRVFRDKARYRSERQRQRLQLVTDATPALISYVDRKQRFRFVNQHYETWFGRSRERIVGKTMKEVLGEEGLEQVAGHVERVLGGEPVRFEALVPRRDGSRWIDAHYVPSRDARGNVVGFFTLVTDITERRKAEQALREETLIAETLNRIGTTIGADLDLKRIVQAVTDQATALTGAQFGAFFYKAVGERGGAYTLCSPSGGSRESFIDLPMPDDPGILAPTLGGEPVVRSEDITEDQRYRDSATSPGMPAGLPVKSYLAVSVISRSGEVLGGLSFAHEQRGIFTARHERIASGIAAQAAIAIDNARLYAQLQDSEQRFRQLAERVKDVFWVVDAQKRQALYVSPAYEVIWGRTCESLYADPSSFTESLHVSDRARVLESIRRQRQGEDTVDEYRIIRADGEIRWISDRAYPIRDETGRVVRVAGVAEDVTERRAAEQLLRDMDQRKDEFLAILGHELRNPLAPLSMAVEVLRNSRGDPERFERSARTVERQTAHLVRLIDDLLDVSRIKGGKIILREQVLDVREVVRQAAEGFGPVCDFQGLTLSVSVPSEPAYVQADPVRLAQVLGNLLNNARKYTERGGEIQLSAQREGDEVVMRVKDTGVGIAAEELSRIFEMFIQVDALEERSRGGLGIGLSLARSLVAMHRGFIEARSDGIGAGSEFVIHLPAAGAPVVDERQGASELRPEEAEARRVLVVDDNEDALSTLALVLEQRGHDVRMAADGQQALAVAEAFRPEVVLLDIGLPLLDGYAVARRIRGEPWGGRMRLVALSGWGQERDRREASAAGFDAHVTKPAPLEQLDDLLRAGAREM